MKPFAIDVPQATLDDLRERLARTRWPDGPLEGWDGGIDPAYLRTLAEHWLVGFDWRAQEAALNRFAQFRADVDGLGVHFIHERVEDVRAFFRPLRAMVDYHHAPWSEARPQPRP